MTQLKSLFFSALLATAALATNDNQYQGGNQYQPQGGQGGNGNGQGGKGQGWNTWGSTSPATTQALAAGACPAGCVPIATGSAQTPQQTQPGQLIVQVVSVADKNGSLKYFPNKISAPVGSIVQFQFHPKNHTITESSFAAPCKAIAANLTSETRPGIKSGFIPVTGTEPFTPVFNVLVNDTKPIWLFCGQVNHCQKGMAMVINQAEGSPNTIEKYIENAAQLPLVSVPAAAPAPPAVSTASVATASAPPPAATTTATEVNPFAAPPAPAATASSTSVVQAPAAETTAATAAGVAPATFTGAASNLNVRDASSFGAVVLGAMVALL